MALASLTDRAPTTPAEAAIDRSAPLKVTGRLKTALDAMVWQGLTRRQAAEQAKLSEHSLYVALTKPHVKAYWRGQLEVLRTSEEARNLHRLAEIRDAGDNMPAVQAIKAMMQMGDDAHRPGGSGAALSAPGLTVVINVPQQPMSATFPTDARNVIEHDQ